jgi:disulfide bond formation protein DsbB
VSASAPGRTQRRANGRLRARGLALAAAAGSLGLLAAAYAFQYWGGLAPCPLCLWQRWPHWAAAGLGLVALMAPVRPLAVLGALVMLAGAGLAGYHVGIEQGWWAGPASCGAPDIAGLSPEELLARIMAAPVVRCDETAWSFLGLSMPAWNGLASLGLAGLWGAAYASSSASQ